MSQSLRVIKACFFKELRVWRRNPRKIMLVILLPLLYFIGFSLLMGGVYYGTGVDTALVVEEQNPGFYTNGLIEILQESDTIPPRLNPIPMDAETADTLFQNGDILLVISIPDGFEDALETNGTTSIHIQVANIHEDLTKNLRMPVIRKLDIFYQTYLLNDSLVDFEVETLRPFSPPRLAYMAWTIAIYSIMFSALFAAGSAMTQEFEQRTMDELTLSNQPPRNIYLGKMLSGVVISFITPPILFILSYLMFGIWPLGDLLIFFLLALLLSVFCSGLGIIAGAILHNSVFLVPVAALAGIFYWIADGGIAPLELVGSSFGSFNEDIPISNVYRSMIRMFIDGTYSWLAVDITIIAIFALVFVVLSPSIAHRAAQVNIGQKLQHAKSRRR
jgi:ABC-type transport system involved in multi-copper enzyme maturation permease subunit